VLIDYHLLCQKLKKSLSAFDDFLQILKPLSGQSAEVLSIFQQILINRIALDEVIFKHSGCPDAELGAT